MEKVYYIIDVDNINLTMEHESLDFDLLKLIMNIHKGHFELSYNLKVAVGANIFTSKFDNPMLT